VTVRQHAQYRSMVNRADGTPPGVTQRDDRGGASIVRVGLVGATSVEQSHPRRQRGWDIDDALARCDELLGEQRAETAGGFDGPGPRFERCRELAGVLLLTCARLPREC